MRSLTVATLAATALVLGGCGYLQVSTQGKGFQLAEETVRSIGRVRADALESMGRLATVMGRLDGMLSDSTVDPRPQHSPFLREIGQLDSQRNRLHFSVGRMDKHAAAYFSTWEAQLETIEGTEVRSRSAERRRDLMDAYAGIAPALAAADEKLYAVITELNDVARFLDLDVTPAGRASISESYARIKQDRADTDRRLEAFVAELDGVSSEFAPSGG